MPPSRLFSAWLIQMFGSRSEVLLPHIYGGGHGVEVADFALPEVLEDQTECRRLVAWYRERLAAVAGPISLHAPFLDLIPASPEPLVVEVARRRLGQALEIASRLGARQVVVHANFNPLVRAPGHTERWLERHVAFWENLLAGWGGQVLFENMWEPEPGLIVRLVEATAHLGTAACLDTGHAHLHSAHSVAQWVEALGPRLAYTHLNDNHRDLDTELPPGLGSIDWPAVAKALERTGVKPAGVPEVGRPEAVAAAERFLAAL